MATLKVRHFVARRRADGSSRYYWQPSNELRAAGWRVNPLGSDHAAALAKAEQINAEVDAWRAGQDAPGAPPAAARRGKAAAPGSVEALVAAYKRSRFWTKLAPATQRQYGWCLDAITAWAGDQPARAITPPAVQAFYAAQMSRVEGKGKARRVIETPAKAAAAVRVLRLLLQAGVRMGFVTHNAAIKPGLVVTRQREPRIWTPAEVRHMAAAADALGWRSIGTAIVLNDWIGQREADVLALRPWAVETASLRLTPNKTRHSTGRTVVLPVHLVPHLVERLRAEAMREKAAPVVKLRPGKEEVPVLLRHEKTGAAWNEHTFRHVFADIREAAAAGIQAPDGSEILPPMPSCADLRFMELRHTAVTTLHGAGVDALGISRITGHSPKTAQAIIEKHYLGESEEGAAAAFGRRLAKEAE
jgi:integrase